MSIDQIDPPAAPGVTPGRRTRDDRALLAALRSGDESAFVELVDRHGPTMLRVARLYVRTEAAAEDVVQETWVRVLESLDRFEARSSLRTWILVILGNCARKRIERDGRTVPVASVEPDVDPGRFFPESHPRWAGMWSTLVADWDGMPDERLLAAEVRARFTAAIAALPPRYATVFTLRDVEGWSSEEVCLLLGLTVANQRILLHRARTRIRVALEEYLEGVSA